tara:strand:- start:1375 stop:2049 length:675 start_codon:yes stop_codon:yes gene_type:complete
MIKNISNLGDAALYCDFGTKVDKETNSLVIKYFQTLKNKNIKGINNLTPSYNKLIVSYDLRKTNFKDVKKNIENISIQQNENLSKNKIEIPVCCEDNFALDISRLEKILNLSRDKIFENFFSKEYFCYMTGFIAGMPFVGDLDKNMRAKRLETPRVKVPKGSIGITEQFANIYTFESPGGWNIIGNSPKKVFNGNNEKEPNLVNPGDTIVFKNIGLREYKNFNE